MRIGLSFVLLVLITPLPLLADEIHKAVRAGDVAKIKALLDANPKLAASTDGDTGTPLYVAVGMEKPDLVKAILALKVDVNGRASGSGATRRR